MAAEAIRTYLEEKHGEMMTLLERLVRIDNRSSNKAGVDRMGPSCRRNSKSLVLWPSGSSRHTAAAA